MIGYACARLRLIVHDQKNIVNNLRLNRESAAMATLAPSRAAATGTELSSLSVASAKAAEHLTSVLGTTEVGCSRAP